MTGGKEGIQKIFILSVQLFYKSKTVLKNKVQLILIICGIMFYKISTNTELVNMEPLP